MVERIVVAGRQVLVDDGYDAFSTNRVATAAGISPGSLYQYFPDKASILDVVVDRYWDEIADRVAASLTDRITEIGPSMVRDTIDALVTALESDRVLLRVVAEELPLARSRERLQVLERRISELATAYLTLRPEASHRPDAAVTAWLLTMSIEYSTVRWLLDRPPVPREQLVEELVALVAGYLLS